MVLALGQEKEYSAQASVRVRDPAEDLSIAGLQATQGDLPAQVAAQAAQTASRTAVLRRVQDQLDLDQTVEEARQNISVSQDPASNLLLIEGTGGTGAEAADLANATAYAVASITDRETQNRYTRLADKLREQSDELGDKLPDDFEQLSQTEQQAYQNVVHQQQVLGEQAARLDALGTVSDIAQVTERATVPSSPDSPKPFRSGLLGGIVGLLIGVLAAKVAESLDRRLRRPEDALEAVGYPLAGALPKDALGSVPVAEAPTQEEVARMDAFRMLRNNLRFLGGKNPPRSIVVTSPLPDEGKTTVAVGLALAAAASGLKVLLVEADLHRPVHAQRLGLRAAPGLADYLREGLRPKDVVQTYDFVDPAVLSQSANGASAEAPRSRLVSITAGNLGLLSAEVIGSEQFAEVLATVRKVYDLVVVDSPPLLAVPEALQIVPLVDAVAYCVRMGQTTSAQAIAGREALARLPERLTTLVLTDVTGHDSPHGYYSYAYSYRKGAEPHATVNG